MCSFSFPVVFWFVFISYSDPDGQKNPTGQKSFVCFGAVRRDTKFPPRVSTLFLSLFQDGSLRWPFAKKGELLPGDLGMDRFTYVPAHCCLR